MRILLQVIVAVATGWLIMLVGNVIEQLMVEDTLTRDVVGIGIYSLIFLIAGFTVNYLGKRLKG